MRVLPYVAAVILYPSGCRSGVQRSIPAAPRLQAGHQVALSARLLPGALRAGGLGTCPGLGAVSTDVLERRP